MRFNLKRIYKNSKEYILFALLLLFAVSLLSLNSNEKIQPVKILAFGSFAYITSIVSEPFSIITNTGELEEQRKLNAELMLENSLLRSKALEFEKLKDLIEFKDSVDAPMISGRVISRFGSISKGKFIIDLGLSDNVKSGMPVITERGLVGLIELSSNDFSVVNHLYNSELSFAVIIRQTNTEGILSWNGNKLVIENIPTTTLVKPGFEVFTSDFSTIFPPNIPVGIVTGIETTIAGLLSVVEIEEYENVESTSRIFVVQISEQNELQTVKESN